MQQGELPSIDYCGDDFVLKLNGSGRTISVPANAHGIEYLKKIIAESKTMQSQPRGYVRNFPTQHVVDQWIKQDHARKEADAEAEREAERETVETKYGIELDKLEIRI